MKKAVETKEAYLIMNMTKKKLYECRTSNFFRGTNNPWLFEKREISLLVALGKTWAMESNLLSNAVKSK